METIGRYLAKFPASHLFLATSKRFQACANNVFVDFLNPGGSLSFFSSHRSKALAFALCNHSFTTFMTKLEHLVIGGLGEKGDKLSLIESFTQLLRINSTLLTLIMINLNRLFNT